MDEGSLKVEPGASLRELALATIRREISAGRLRPGARLVERDLCDDLGVSRTVIREAIRHLTAEGYVADVPRKGPIVAPLDETIVRSIFEVREALETHAAALFVERASDADRTLVSELAARLAKFETKGDYVEGLRIVKELHQVINRASGNILFDSLLAPLTGRIQMLQARAAADGERRSQAVRNVTAMAAALVGSEPQAAVAAVRTCLHGAAEFALQSMDPDPD